LIGRVLLDLGQETRPVCETCRPKGPRRRPVPDPRFEGRAGIREVQMSPDLVEAFVEHLDRLRRAGLPTGPAASPSPTGPADE
jgi:hypothetical protein